MPSTATSIPLSKTCLLILELKTGASVLGLQPIKRTRSAS